MKSLAELQALRDSMKGRIGVRDDAEGNIRVVVGMATCGIAAGAANATGGNAKQCDAARAAQRSRGPDSVGR